MSLLSLLSLISQLSRCQIYFHTALLQLQTIADMFVLVCIFDTISQSVNGWRDDHGPTNVGVMVKGGYLSAYLAVLFLSSLNCLQRSTFLEVPLTVVGWVLGCLGRAS